MTTSSGRKRGRIPSAARVPGTLTRSMAGFLLERDTTLTRRSLGLLIREALGVAGLTCDPATIDRQLNGFIASVPIEMEQAVRAVALARLQIADAHELDRMMVEAGVEVPGKNKEPDIMSVTRLRPLVELWLYLNPNTTVKGLATKIRALERPEVSTYTILSLERILRGNTALVHFAFLQVMLELLRENGITSEEDALTRSHTESSLVKRSLRQRVFEPVARTSQLVVAWRVLYREPQVRPLARELQRRFAERGTRFHLDSLLDIIGGHVRYVRRGVGDLIEEIIREKDSSFAMEHIAMLTDRLNDLRWLRAEPIIVAAKEWLGLNPESSQHALAAMVATTAKRMGYRCRANRIEHVFGGYTRTTRAFVYRALLAQFKGRRGWKLPKKFLVVRPDGSELCDLPSVTVYLERAREILPRARTAHFARGVAVRAEYLYGIPRDEAEQLIRGTSTSVVKVPALVPNTKPRSVEEVAVIDEEFDS